MTLHHNKPVFLFNWFMEKRPDLLNRRVFEPEEKESIKEMCSLKRLTAIRTRKPIKKMEWEELENIAKGLFGHEKYVRLLVFDPETEKEIIKVILKNI